jgi:beta-glucosidase
LCLPTQPIALPPEGGEETTTLEKEFFMRSEGPIQSALSAGVSRREFLVGSMVSIAAASLYRNAWADTAGVETGGGISDAAFESAKKRAAALVSQMTIGEIATQVVNDAAAIPRLELPKYRYWSEALHGVNVDGPITSFPQPIALGCSWNPDLVHRVYTAVSDEARAFHNKTGYGLAYFSPATVNMGLRDPRWGRVNENFSEDPLLVQVLAVQAIRAMQGNDPKFLKTIACAKHYICNDTDTDRDYADATPDRRSFWEYYTRGFEACVKEAKVFSVMSAYSSLWGIPCSANHMLLTEILRDRWGFNGYVVSDCDAIADIYQTHHYVQTAPEAAAAAIKAGSDLNCGDTLSRYLTQAVEDKLVTEEPIRAALTRILTGRFLLGEFDAQDHVPWSSLSPEILEGQAHRELAREAARQSVVLLKNERQLLPLNKASIKKVAVIGPMAAACHLGGYSGRATYLVSPYLGIAEALGVSPYWDAMPAGEYQTTSNFRGPVVSFAADGSQFLTNIANDDWAQYGPLDFTGKTSIEFHLASSLEGEISVYLDSLESKPIVTAHVPNTGGRDTWQKVSAELSGIAGCHAAFLKFSATGQQHFLDLQSFRLLPATTAKQSPQRLVYAPGSTIIDPKNDALFAAAVNAAAESDVALVFVGDNRLLSDEGRDRTFLHLPEVQQDLVKAVLAANPRTVVIVSSDCPVAINWEQEHAPAVLCCFSAGEQQGNAVADALFGDYNPSGKLCSTWYRDEDQLPNFHDYDIKHGRTYMYPRRDPLYPFGHGLSYTTFSYKNLNVSDSQLLPDKAVSLTMAVSNTGRVAGSEIVQFYVQAGGGRQRPEKQLAGFQRVNLQPGESKTITFSLRHDHIALRYWDEDKEQFAYDPSKVGLLIGASSADIRLQSSVALL